MPLMQPFSLAKNFSQIILNFISSYIKRVFPQTHAKFKYIKSRTKKRKQALITKITKSFTNLFAVGFVWSKYGCIDTKYRIHVLNQCMYGNWGILNLKKGKAYYGFRNTHIFNFEHFANFIDTGRQCKERDAKKTFYPTSYIECLGMPRELLRIVPDNYRGQVPFNLVISPHLDDPRRVRKVVFLGTVDGYFHQLLEYLPLIVENRDTTFVMNCTYLNSMKKLLEFFEIEHKSFESDSLMNNQNLFLMHNALRYKVTRSQNSIYPDEKSIYTMRSTIQSILNKSTTFKLNKLEPSEALYLSRQGEGTGRNVLNEVRLTRAFTCQGISTQFIKPSKLTISDQFQMFTTSSMFIGAHGGVLAI